MKQPSTEPSFFIRSFLVVAFHYVLVFLLLLLAMLGIAWLGFPKVYEMWTSDPETFQKIWDQTPELLWPTGLCLALLGVNVVLTFLIGFQIGWMAPYPKSAHGVFLAVVCLVSYLQIALTQPPVPKWLVMSLLLTTPVFIVVGARTSEWLFAREEDTDQKPAAKSES